MAEYCLRWNNHQPNLVTVFTELLSSESLVDVTLATDGQSIRAHKLVLSACSSYFKELFGHNPCTHPIVFLKEVRYEDLKTVIDFIYKGEVNVAQDRLQDVIKTADLLKIKGLADKTLNYNEYPSHCREQLSSSFSSQRSSLTDSRELVASTEEEHPSSPPMKRRKVASEDSDENQSVSVAEGGNEGEERSRIPEVNEPRQEDKSDEESMKGSPAAHISYEPREKIKEEKDTDQQESGAAADAMLLLRSSSETETPHTSTASNGSNILPTHSQARGKRVLKRQPGITKEVAVEEDDTAEIIPTPAFRIEGTQESLELFESDVYPDYVRQSSLSRSSESNQSMRQSSIARSSESNQRQSSISRESSQSNYLQVPQVVVDRTYTAKPYLTVPSSSSGPIRHHSQPSTSGSLLAKQRSHPSVLTHTERTKPHHMTLVPMQIIKQKSSPGSLVPVHGHLRPIQPKPDDKKENPVIQLINTDNVVSPVRMGRAVSEEPVRSHEMHTSTLIHQSVSQDTGMSIRPSLSARISLTKEATNPQPTTVAHTPSLREGPALGCNFCWNTPDKEGRVQRRKTKYHCPDCRTNLCIVPCFHEFHSQMQYKQDMQKQLTKILPKTSSL